jgi:ABC-type uncharacterized transport system involved in gliding motility auxiliary subunit
MKVTRRSRLLLRLQSLIFTVLFIAIIGMLAWLSTQYVYQTDWTSGARNTISDGSRRLLDAMDQPVQISAFVREDELTRNQIKDLIGTYQRFKDDITLEFINPDLAPERIRELGIASGGEIVIRYRDRIEKIQTLSERHLTNALLRLTRQDQRWIVFLTGHGERYAGGETNHGLGEFSQELERKGLNVQSINLVESEIPSNTNLLVLASPQTAMLPGEMHKLQSWIEKGGNLLWLGEPDTPPGLEPLSEQLGIHFLPGTVVDATTQMFGIENPTFVVITGYPRHDISREMTTVTVFPEAAALETNDSAAWNVVPLLTTLEHSWTEVGEVAGEISFDSNEDERAGPLDIGVALTRSLASETDEEDAGTPEQRVVVIGDGDFLSNTYLGNPGNLDLGLNIVRWLSHDDASIEIRVKSAPDTTLVLGRVAQAVIAIGFLIGIPLLLLLLGIGIWLRRRRR